MMERSTLPLIPNYGIRLLFFVLFLSFCNFSSAAIEPSSSSSSSSSSDYERDFSDYQRRSLLPPPRSRNSQLDPRIGISSSKQETQKVKTRNRRDQSKDLKKLIQELEESDYSNYGSWGNFRQKQPLPKKTGKNLLKELSLHLFILKSQISSLLKS